MQQDHKNKLIGLVALEYVKQVLNEYERQDISGKLRLDSFEPEMLAVCMNTIASDAISMTEDDNGVEIKLPVELVDPNQIERKEILFNGNAAAARNSYSSKRLVLFANGNMASANTDVEDVEDTLRQVTAITQERLLENARYWVKALSQIYPQLQLASATLGQQLQSMFDAFTRVLKRNILTSEAFAYGVAESIIAGDPIAKAVNENLAVLGCPRYAEAMPRKGLEDRLTWERTFKKIEAIPTGLFYEASRPLALTRTVLNEHYEAIKDDISEETAKIYQSIVAEDGLHSWSELLTLDWDSDRLSQFLSEKPVREQRQSLGAVTLAFFEECQGQALNLELKELGCTLEQFLREFAENDKLIKTEEVLGRARIFYSYAATYLSSSPALDKKWDKYLFKDDIEETNFLNAVLKAAMILAERNRTVKFKDPVLLLNCENKTEDLVQVINENFREYFSTMYRGLERECGEFIAFRFMRLKLKRTNGLNLLFHFKQAKEFMGKRFKDAKPSRSVSKGALELKFQVCIVERADLDEPKNRQLKTVRIRWFMKKNDLSLSLSRDPRALSKRGTQDFAYAFRVVYGRNFKQTNSKGLLSQISLSDAGSFGLTGGCFVDRNGSNLQDLSERFRAIFKTDVPGVDVEQIRESWEVFVEYYSKALRAFAVEGLGAKEIPDMYAAWGELLHVVNENAVKSQHFRLQALSTLLSIGVFSFVDQTSSNAVVMPWHPVRLYELHCDFIEKMALVKMLVQRKGDEFADSKEFIADLWRREEYFMPQFVLAPHHAELSDDGVCRDLLAPVEHLGGYTLYSRIAGPNCRNSGLNMTTVNEFGGVAEDYRRLMPQATNNVNISLPDAISKSFPLAVMGDLAKRFPDNEYVTLFVGGINAGGYTAQTEEDLYQGLTQESQTAESMEEAGLTAASFKARLQFAVFRSDLQYGNLGGTGKFNVRPYDLAFIDRFFTYSAKHTWVCLPKPKIDRSPYNFSTKLQRATRRLVSLEDEFVSKTLLCDRLTDSVDREYINSACWLLENQAADKGDSFAFPCLNVNCADSDIRNCIQDLHKVAQWVVTCNDLIDRRQLINNDIKLVRYKRNESTGRTVMISSEMPTELLISRIKFRLGEMNLGVGEFALEKLALRILQDSYRISGYVALRSAKLDTGANEIIGLALSNWLARSEACSLSEQAGETVLAAASFLVDDYASFFLKGAYLADLICLVVSVKDAELYLHIYVTESKFYQASLVGEGKHKSSVQLMSTVGVLERALVDSERAAPERPIWLGLFANMVLSMARSDVVDQNKNSLDIICIADRIAAGDVQISINAASHVFVHDEAVPAEVTELSITAGQGAQYVLGSDVVSRLLLQYDQDGNPNEVVEKALQYRPFIPAFKPLNLIRPWQWAEGIRRDWVVQETTEDKDVSISICPLFDESDTQQRTERDVSAVKEESIQTEVAGNGTMMAMHEKLQQMQVQVSSDTPYAPSFAALVKAKGTTFSYSPERQEWAKQATEMLRLQFVSKGIPAKVISYSLTPNGCLVSFEGDERLTTKEVLSMKDTLLSTKSINIVFARPAPRRFNVLFNDPTQKRESVSIWNAWLRRPIEPRQGGINFSYIVGLKEEDGEILCLDPLYHDPHTLVAGGTGSGKTVLVQTMLLDMAATNPSSKLKIIILDPKGGIDFGPICQLPHMAGPIVSEMEEGMRTLNQLADEMDRRYELLRSVGAKNIQRYNAKVRPEQQLPVLFLVHDELPDWMQSPDYAKCLGTVVTRLATKARASGIYLILIAQRPDKDVIPMQIRENLGNRLVLKLPALSSEIALGEKGAENLLGKGHLAAKLGGTISYAQAPFVDEENGELDEVVEAIIKGDKEWT